MINYVTGPLGAGKSAFVVMKGVRALLSGRVFAGNIRFVENWEHLILRHAPHYILAGRRGKLEYRVEIERRYYYTENLSELVNLRLHGRGESRGVRAIDEAHNLANNRDWANKEQNTYLRKMALARKRGWDDYIVAQHADNTDASLRRIASQEIRLLDWKQVLRLPILGTQLLPFHLFLAQSYLRNVNKTGSGRQSEKAVSRELHLRGWWCNVYDTFEDYDIESGDTRDATWLPKIPGIAPEGQTGVWEPGGGILLTPKTNQYGVKA